jgi:hypothetical protein
VLTTVCFDHKLALRAKEIEDVPAKLMLTAEFHPC